MSTVSYPETGHDWCADVEDTSWWFRHRNRVLLEVMRRFPPRAPLYDVGGGNGVVASALQSAGIATVVVEPGAAGARRAAERGLDVIPATLENADLAPGSLASIGMFDVVEHIVEPIRLLQRAYALLRQHGRIYVTVPAYRALWSAEDDYAEHYERYTLRSMRNTLEAAGFDFEFATYMFALLPLPILFLRTIPYRLGRARPFTREAVRHDHSAGNRFSREFIDRLLELEFGSLRRRGGLPFGASLLAVATKTP